METETMVKRVIDGKAYNTDTSELIANCGGETNHRIYRTRSGAYFLTWTDDNAETRLDPLKREEAKAIVTGTNPEYQGLKFNIVGNDTELRSDTPEAEAEGGADQQSVIFFRVSRAFKTSIENAAKASNLSVNAWLLRITEKEMQKAAN